MKKFKSFEITDKAEFFMYGDEYGVRFFDTEIVYSFDNKPDAEKFFNENK